MTSSKINIGTDSWTDRSLIESGLYYPDWCTSSEDRLRFYAAEFPLVEVDSSYYGMPSVRNSVLWVERTPEDFIFNVKAFRLFTTHQTQPQALPRTIRDDLPHELAGKRTLYYRDVPSELKDKMWQMFEAALLPLMEANKLGVVVFQFPPWFMPRKESFSHLDECREHLSRYRLAVEFRNQYWLDGNNLEDTLSFLRRNRLSFVAVDEPQGFKSSVPPVADVTGEVGMVRFHGRNRDTWEKKGLKSSSERFDYYYSQDEMEEWVPKIKMMERFADEVHVVMNTNNRDQAVVNARLAAKLLGEEVNPRAFPI